MRTKRESRLLAYSLAACLSPGIGIVTEQEAVAQQTFNFTTAGQWDTAASWTPTGVPGVNDTARIGLLSGGTPATASTGSPKTISDLLVWQGASLATSNDLNVTTSTTINNGSLVIHNGDTFTTNSLLVTGSGSSVDLDETLAVNGTATIDLGNTIYTGNNFSQPASIQLGPNATGFNNNGLFTTGISLTTLSRDPANTTASFDLSGSAGTGVVKVTGGGDLLVTAPLAPFTGSMEISGNDTFESTGAWYLDGAVDMINGGGILRGGQITIRNNGVINLINTINTGSPDFYPTIESDLILNDQASIVGESSHNLTLKGITTVNAGLISIHNNNGITFDNNATFNGGTLEAKEVYVSQNDTNDLVVTIEPSTSFTWDSQSTIDLYVDGTMNLNRDAISPQQYELFGDIDVNEGGTLNLNTDVAGGAYLDAGTEVHLYGALNASTYTSPTPTNLEVEGLLRVKSSTASINASRLEAEYLILHTDVEFDLDSESYVRDMNLYSGSTLSINGPSEFWGGSSPIINSGAVANVNDTLIVAGSADFTGSGTLAIDETGTLSTSSSANIGVHVVNNGVMAMDYGSNNAVDLEIGASGDAKSFTQSNTGVLQLDIAGSSSDEANFDEISVYGDVALDGTLDIDDSSYTMVAGDTYRILEILSAGGDITGAFDTVTGLPAYSSLNTEMSGLFYTAKSVDVLTVIAGDLDGDGFVGVDDLQLVLGNFNTSVPVLAFSQGDANGDAYVGIDDLNAVLNNWNNGTPPSVSVTIPEPASLALLSLGGLAMLRRTRN